MDALVVAIAAVVDGDLSSLAMVRAASHQQLLDASASLPKLVVSRLALARVLNAWRHGPLAAEEVQQWASFVRRGYVSGRTSEKLRPITIDYDANDEAVIAEIIGRLDEIGDRVDGRIDAREREEMLRAVELRG